MKTILVPVDFSATAHNSALYAAGLARAIGASNIILFNAYSIPLATEMSWAVLQTEELRKYSEEGLNDFKKKLESEIGNGIVITCQSEFGFLTERVEAACVESGADLIVMGITGGGKLEEVIIGSNTTHIVKHVPVPVLIVPSEAKWQPVKKIGWACDYKDVITTTPTEKIKNIVADLHSTLVIVHNNPDPDSFDPDKISNNEMVADLFRQVRPEFVQVSNDHFADAMNDFVKSHEIDMVLVIPKKQSWLDSLFHPSHTRQLAFHSHVPLLCVQPMQH